MRGLVLAQADDGLDPLAQLVDARVVLKWTPALRTALETASEVPLDLEAGPTTGRVLRHDVGTIRLRPGTHGCLTHRRALVLVHGEEQPRWVDSSRVREFTSTPETISSDEMANAANEPPLDEMPDCLEKRVRIFLASQG